MKDEKTVVFGVLGMVAIVAVVGLVITFNIGSGAVTTTGGSENIAGKAYYMNGDELSEGGDELDACKMSKDSYEAGVKALQERIDSFGWTEEQIYGSEIWEIMTHEKNFAEFFLRNNPDLANKYCDTSTWSSIAFPSAIN